MTFQVHPALIPGTREERLERALDWVTTRYEQTLAGKPVRDGDEAIDYARNLLAEEKK